MLGVEDPWNPEENIEGGVRYFAQQMDKYGRIEFALAAYNAGPRVARRWLERFPIEDADAFVERIPYKETRLYVKKVLKNFAIYKTLNGSKPDA